MAERNDMEYHPIANIFPMMPAHELSVLADDIKQTGLQSEILLYENAILDGRNRYEACLLAGTEPEFKQYEGTEPLQYIISLNLIRRHLNETQRAVIASKLANITHGGDRRSDQTANLPFEISQPEAAEMLNVSERTIRTVKEIDRKAPEYINKMESGEITANEAIKEIKAEIKESKREAKAAAKSYDRTSLPEHHLIHGDFKEIDVSRPIDIIITDPPYPKEFLPLYNDLAKWAANILPIGGSLLVMCGQSYLPAILWEMNKYLKYQWMLAYLTPGGQAVQLWDRKVNTFWKPVLWFLNGDYTGDWQGDVLKSNPNDNDKRFHKWGQSESGMADIIERFTYPGQTILDPFCGGGTTGIVSVSMGRHFVGIDIDKQSIEMTKERINGIAKS